MKATFKRAPRRDLRERKIDTLRYYRDAIDWNIFCRRCGFAVGVRKCVAQYNYYNISNYNRISVRNITKRS